MKLVRYGNPGKEKPGLIDADGKLRDLSKVVKDITPEQLGDVALEKLRKGMFMVVRESSISHFLQGNIQVVTKCAPMAAHQFAADPLPPSRACRHALPGNGQCMLACVRGWLDKEMIWR